MPRPAVTIIRFPPYVDLRPERKPMARHLSLWERWRKYRERRIQKALGA